MGVLPQGTFNYFVRTHGIPTNAADAAQALLYSVPAPVQVGLINDRVFLVNASLGLYPELLQDREVYKALFRGAIGTLGETSTVESFKFHRMVVAPRLLLVGRRTVKVALDGEVTWMRVPLDFRVSPKPLYLLKPRSEELATDLGQDDL